MIKAAVLMKMMVIAGTTLAACAGSAQQASAQPNNPSWTEVIPPFRIADRIYYVGSRELAAYLIDGGSGLILLDAGLPEFAPQVLKNVRTLGFDPRKIRILLNSQGHFDHAGGLGTIKAATGARMLASRADAPLLERGGKGDFEWGDDVPYPPVKVDGLVGDGQRIRLGSAHLTAHLTPGHTKGCTTWTMPVRVDGRTRTAQFNCSTSIPGYKLLATPAYPNMARDYARTFDKLRTVPCDLFLGSHGSFFDLDSKRAKLGASPRENPFVDPEGCRRHLRIMEQRFTEQLARERAAAGVVQK